MKKLPNLLTSLRFFLVFIFIFVFYSEHIQKNIQWAIVVFVVAGVTDVLDGYIARKYDAITDFGKLMDPLADKLMMLTALVCLFTKEFIPIVVIVMVLVKDFLLVVGAALLYKQRDYAVSSNRFGKIAAVALNISLVLVVFEAPFSEYVLFFSAFLGLIACGQYFIINIQRARRNHEL